MKSTFLNYSMHPKDEHSQFPVSFVVDPQPPNSRDNMAEKENDKPQVVKCVYQLWNLFHMTLHLLEKYNRASEKIKFVH